MVVSLTPGSGAAAFSTYSQKTYGPSSKSVTTWLVMVLSVTTCSTSSTPLLYFSVSFVGVPPSSSQFRVTSFLPVWMG